MPRARAINLRVLILAAVLAMLQVPEHHHERLLESGSDRGRVAVIAGEKQMLPSHRPASSGSGVTLGARRRNFMSPAPVAFPARFLKNSAAVSTTPTFSATATAIHWFSETPSSLARRCAAFLIDTGSFNGYVALLIVSPFLVGQRGEGLRTAHPPT